MKKREELQKVYNSKRWQRIRKQVIQRDRGLCQKCLKSGKLTPGYIVHHIIELTLANMHDDDIAFGLDNLVYLCNDCHEETHGRKSSITVEGVTISDTGEIIINC